MAKSEKKDWSQEVSGQIAVCKTDKTLLELWDSLKPASELFPAHIHAAGEKAEMGGAVPDPAEHAGLQQRHRGEDGERLC